MRRLSSTATRREELKKTATLTLLWVATASCDYMQKATATFPSAGCATSERQKMRRGDTATPPPAPPPHPSSHTPSSHTPLKSKIANNLSWRSTWGKLWSSVYEQISQHIFVQNVVTMFIILQIFFVTSVIWKLRNVTRVFPRFAWGVFSHVTRLDDSRASGNIWWIITLNLTLVTLTVSIQHSISHEKC